MIFGMLYETLGHRSTLLIAAALVIVPALLVLTVRQMTLDYESDNIEQTSSPTKGAP